jgi:hypothetical protein
MSREPRIQLPIRLSRRFVVTFERDGSGWHFAAWSHGDRNLRPPAAALRRRHFHSWHAAAELFRRRFMRTIAIAGMRKKAS